MCHNYEGIDAHITPYLISAMQLQNEFNHKNDTSIWCMFFLI